MLRQMGSICATLVVAAVVSFAPAHARGGDHYSGGHYSGAHYSGVRHGAAGRYAGYRGYSYAGHYGYAHGHWRHRYGGYWGPYYGGGYYGDYWGYYAAAEPTYDDTDAVSYCMQRFRTYDPSSGTYVGYDGYRHSCP